MRRRHVLPALLVALAGLIATLAASRVSWNSFAHYPDIMGCEEGCEVAAGGWPLPYVIDYPGISPVGSVSLSDALLGIDRIAIAALLVNLVFWTALAAVLLLAWKQMAGRARH